MGFQELIEKNNVGDLMELMNDMEVWKMNMIILL